METCVKKTLWLILIGTALALTAGLMACDEEFDTYEDPSLEEILKIGKGYLMNNRGAQGAEAFREASNRYPESSEAYFGMILGNTMSFINLVDELIDLVGSLLLTAPPDPETADSNVIRQELSATFGDALQEFFYDLIGIPFEENERAFSDLEENGEFLFDIEYYQFIFKEEAIVSFGGQFDKTDGNFFGAISSLMNFVTDLLLAHDINFDFDALLGGTEPTDETDPPEEDVSLLDSIDELLNNPDYPNFLYVKGEEGLARMRSAGVNLGNFFSRFAAMFTLLAQEKDYQGDDQIRYLDLDKDNHWDQLEEPVYLGTLMEMGPGLAPVVQDLCEDLALAFWEGSVADPHPYTKDKLTLGMFNGLLIYLGVFDKPILPDWIGFDVGSFFSDPTDDGLRTLILLLMDLLALLKI